jgi:UDP-N-acetyl-D-mannosaminuronic acid dehydrogenase
LSKFLFKAAITISLVNRWKLLILPGFFLCRLINIRDIRNKHFALCVVGMGRIGLPLALSFSSKGVKVFGVEKNESTLQLLKEKKLPFYEAGLQEALEKSDGYIFFESYESFSFEQCHIIIIAIGTPLNENFTPNMSSIQDVVKSICKTSMDDSIVILRSTLVPGTSEKIILPLIRRLKKSLHVVVCPERVVEGHVMKEIATLPEIVGTDDEQIGNIVRELLLLLGQSKKITITNSKTAEAAKLFNNVYRYVTFALANEFALISEKIGIDAREAIGLANKAYPRSNIPLPGPAAGPCLRKDGFFLPNISNMSLTRTAWSLNESITVHIIETIESAYGNIAGKKIGLLGKTYKANVDDLRDSLAIKLIEELRIQKSADVISYDPYTTNSSTLQDVLNSEIVILAVNHSAFNKINEDMLKNVKLIYDVWGQLSHLDFRSYGINYIALGKLKNEITNNR